MAKTTTVAREMVGSWTVAMLGGPETVEGTLHSALRRASEQDGAAVLLGDATIASGDDIEEWILARETDGAEQLRDGIELDFRLRAVDAGWLEPVSDAQAMVD